MTTKILTLGISRDDIEQISSDSDKVLLTADTLMELEATLDIEEEIDIILLDSHYSACIQTELNIVLGLTPVTTKIALRYYLADELNLDHLRQLVIMLICAPVTLAEWLSISSAEPHPTL